MTEPATVHAYVATACQHDLHASCRFFCKFCPAQCSCDCHAGTTEPYPGYDAGTEARLRVALRDAIRAADIEPIPRRVETLVDIVTTVLHEIAKDEARA
jgi:hypothetical protein